MIAATSIPMAGLGAALEETAYAWQHNLQAMHRRGQYILGEQVTGFQREFALSMGGSHSVGVGTGTAAIELCLRAAGITSRTQEVLIPSMTSLFTAQAVLAAGATPRFVDVDPEHLLIDAEQIRRHCGPNTAAVIAVHLYGQPCAMEEIAAFCRQQGLVLIQDACQAHGALADGKPLASFSQFVAYSFYPTKNLGALGDGGAVVTTSPGVAALLSRLRDGGREGDQISRLPALNSRLDEIQACYLRAFLPRLADWNARRAKLAAIYDEALADCEEVHILRHRPGSVHHLYVIQTERREALRAHLSAHGICTGIHYPVPLHRQPAFEEFALNAGEALPVAEAACQRILSLPLWPHLPEEAAGYVADQVKRFYS